LIRKVKVNDSFQSTQYSNASVGLCSYSAVDFQSLSRGAGLRLMAHALHAVLTLATALADL
jgi:hypothetical protein